MKIAIAGYGLEGEQNYKYWSIDTSNQLVIFDESLKPARPIPSGVDSVLGSEAFGKIDDSFDLVVRTASLNPSKLENYHHKIWSQTNEFFDKCPATIIGVTGSKGKGTTSCLIASILESAGKKVWLVGNIGNLALENLDQISSDDIVVFELSSFQLWDIKKSPHIAVVLYIEPEHLDIHGSMADYIEAKAQITRYQKLDDVLIYNADNTYSKAIAERTNATTVPYPSKKYAHIVDDNFYYGEEKICSTKVLKLLGPHNQQNALAAIDAIWGITQDTHAITQGLTSFTGLPHRLSFVGNKKGIDFYDDSIATTQGSAIAAINSFPPGQGKVIILGGSSKGSDFSQLAESIKKTNTKAILFGSEAEKIGEAFKKAGFMDYETMPLNQGETKENGAGDKILSRIVKRAVELSEEGGVVLFSPAAASFDLFENYSDRGVRFNKVVNNL